MYGSLFCTHTPTNDVIQTVPEYFSSPEGEDEFGEKSPSSSVVPNRVTTIHFFNSCGSTDLCKYSGKSLTSVCLSINSVTVENHTDISLLRWINSSTGEIFQFSRWTGALVQAWHTVLFKYMTVSTVQLLTGSVKTRKWKKIFDIVKEWEIRIESGMFQNVWETPNEAYLYWSVLVLRSEWPEILKTLSLLFH